MFLRYLPHKVNNQTVVLKFTLSQTRAPVSCLICCKYCRIKSVCIIIEYINCMHSLQIHGRNNQIYFRLISFFKLNHVIHTYIITLSMLRSPMNMRMEPCVKASKLIKDIDFFLWLGDKQADDSFGSVIMCLQNSTSSL